MKADASRGNSIAAAGSCVSGKGSVTLLNAVFAQYYLQSANTISLLRMTNGLYELAKEADKAITF